MFLRCNLATLVALALVGVSQSLEASKIGLIIGPDRLTSENDKNLINELDDAEFGSAPLTAENGQTWRNEYHQSSCQLVQIVHLLRHTGCQSKAIASFACSGLCLSYVKVGLFQRGRCRASKVVWSLLPANFMATPLSLTIYRRRRQNSGSMSVIVHAVRRRAHKRPPSPLIVLRWIHHSGR